MYMDGWTVYAAYDLVEGSVIKKHQHDWAHTICLLSGAGEFQIYEGEEAGITIMEIGTHYLLPEKIDHELRSLADNTSMVAMRDLRHLPQAKAGGVLMADGTVIYETT